VEEINVYPKGSMDNTFEWGLGKAKNNQVEEFILFLGLRILNDKNIKNLIVIWDSIPNIKLILKVSPSSDVSLIRIIT
jgi:hypothetical protein